MLRFGQCHPAITLGVAVLMNPWWVRLASSWAREGIVLLNSMKLLGFNGDRTKHCPDQVNCNVSASSSTRRRVCRCRSTISDESTMSTLRKGKVRCLKQCLSQLSSGGRSCQLPGWVIRKEASMRDVSGQGLAPASHFGDRS